MPIGHKKYRKGKILDSSPAALEGLAVARALAWRNRIKSRAMVKRRSKGPKYRVFRKDREELAKRPGLKNNLFVGKIAPYDSFQFPTDSPELGDIGQGQQIMLDRWKFYRPIDPTPKKIIKNQKNKKMADFEELLKKIETNKIKDII